MYTTKTFSCFGHLNVNLTDELKERIRDEIYKAIVLGYRVFLFGGRSNFEDFVYDIISEFADGNKFLFIKRIFCFPLDSHLRKPPAWYVRKKYEGYDCPVKKFDSWYKSIYYRNCAMIDQSDFVLFYAEERPDSGAYKTYKYAVKTKKNLVNLALD